jgi:hypothetical protein
MVMKPSAAGLSSTTAIMRAPGGGIHLEHAIAALRADPFDGMA